MEGRWSAEIAHSSSSSCCSSSPPARRAPGAQSAPTITTPKQQLGANIGDDYGTFKFLFNGIYYTKAMPPRAGETSQTAQ